jgi:uncharacterized Zn finger protein
MSDWGWYYPRSTPRKAKDGIRLHAGKGIAQSWWGEKWVRALESFGWHTRLTRGRNYARKGQVVSIELKPGEVLSRVQGSKPKPYEVRIGLRRIPRKDWLRVADILAKKAVFTAKLLAGEMPEGLEEAFRKGGVPLFPKSKKDLETECTCPDWENPCKHIAAAYYILAQELDRDPFLLLKIRGLEKEEFLSQVRSSRREGPAVPNDPDGHRPSGAVLPAVKSPKKRGKAPVPHGTQLAVGDLGNFYRLGRELPSDWGPSPDRIAQAPAPGSLVKEMGVPPFWRGDISFPDIFGRAMESVRADMAARAGVEPKLQSKTHGLRPSPGGFS